MIVPWIDIARFAYDAGFRGEDHATVVALSQPESGRESKAHNGDDPEGGSFGLLQINGVHLKPGGTLSGWTIEDLYNPVKNLLAAFLVYKANGSSFNPWGAYTSKLHERWLPTARVALDGRQRIVRLEGTIEALKPQITLLRAEVDGLKQDVAARDQVIDSAKRALGCV